MTGFQTQVNATPAPAVAGDFASANPRASVLAGEGGFIAGAGGVTVGRFAWIDDDGVTVLSHGTATRAPDGFVHREQQALITTYMAETSNVIPEGFPVTLMNAGDFWALLTGANAAVYGSALFADYATGAVTAVAASTGASVTGVLGSTNTALTGATFTASVNSEDSTKIDVTSVTGLLSVGDTVSGTGITAGTTIVSQDEGGTAGGAGTYELSAVNTTSAATCTCFGKWLKTTSTTGLISVGDIVAGGTGFPVGATIVSQLSGTAGGAGVYEMSAPATAYVASAASVTTRNVTINVTAIGSGLIHVGDAISGSGIPSGSVIASQVSGSPGGIGVYTIDTAASAYAASTTITVVAGVSLALWKAKSAAAVGELVKISTWGV